MIEISKLAYESFSFLLKEIIKANIDFSSLDFFHMKRIESKIENAMASVIEPLVIFLNNEKISIEKQELLINTFSSELKQLLDNSKILMEGSLDGQKIFQKMYETKNIPQEIVEDELSDIYLLFGPRILTIMCQIPNAIKNWESEAWAESYKRLDDIASNLRQILLIMDSLVNNQFTGDQLLNKIKRAQTQKTRLEYDLTGLRSEKPLIGRFENFFVHPDIILNNYDNQKNAKVEITTKDESIQKFVHEKNKSLIIGTAGSGKSTWSKWLQIEALGSTWDGICCRVELRGITQENLMTITEIIKTDVGIHLAEEINIEIIRRWVENNQVLLLLDGFDEIKENDRDRVYEWINGLESTNPGCKMVVTTRPLTTSHIKQFFEQSWKNYEIMPFDQIRIQEFIERWYKYNPDLPESDRETDIVSLAERLNSDPTIQPLTGNPLLLSTLLMVNYLDGSLPSGRAQLYNRYIEGMLGIWDDRRKIKTSSIQLTLEEKRNIIKGFALKLFFNEKDQIDESCALEWIKDIVAKINKKYSAEHILNYLRERTGLIVGPGIYSFAHKSIAEYLIATVVLQGDQRDQYNRRIDRMCLFEKRNSDLWNTIIFLWAGIAPISDLETFIDNCLKSSGLDLACGLILDQYDRFSIDLKEHFKDEIFKKIGKKTFSQDELSWGISGTKEMREKRLDIPTFKLRGLVPHVSFHSLFSKLAKETIIKCDEYRETENEMLKELFWMEFVADIRQIENVKSALKWSIQEIYINPEWEYWLFTRVIRNAFYLSITNLFDIISVYRKKYRNIDEYLVIIIINIIAEQNDLWMHHIAKIKQKSIQLLLKYLIDVKDSRINETLLLSTREWLLVRNHANPEDLLNKVIDILSVESDKDEYNQQCIEIINKIVEERKLLMPK